MRASMHFNEFVSAIGRAGTNSGFGTFVRYCLLGQEERAWRNSSTRVSRRLPYFGMTALSIA